MKYDLANLLDFAALNYTPVVTPDDQVVWFEDESAGYPAEDVVKEWQQSLLHSEQEHQRSVATDDAQRTEP